MSKRQGQSFNVAEVDAITQLFTTLRRGGDPRQILRSLDVQSVERKFRDMAKHAKRATTSAPPAEDFRDLSEYEGARHGRAS